MTEPQLKLLHDLLGAIRGIRDDIHAIREHQQTTKEKSSNDPLGISIRASAGLPVTVREHYESPKSEKRWNLWKRAKICLEVIGFGSAIVAAVFTVKTLHQIKRQADIAKDQWSDANANFRTDQRAWVKFEVETSPIHIAVGEGVRIPARLVNTGKTSALNIRSRIVVQILRSDREIAPDPEQQLDFPGMPPSQNSYRVTDLGVNHIESGIIYPNNDPSPAWVYLIGKSKTGDPIPEVMTKLGVSAMEHNLSYIAIWGQAWYEDIFGKTHWAKFCTGVALVGLQTRSPKCARFNNVDR